MPERAAPRFAQHVDLLLSEALAQQHDQGVGVLDVTPRSECLAIHGVERFSCAGLFPVDDDEMIFQPAQGVARGRQLAAARPAGQEEQHRFRSVFAADRDPLPAAVERDLLQRGDAARQRVALAIGDGRSLGESLRGDDRQDPHQEHARQRDCGALPGGLKSEEQDEQRHVCGGQRNPRPGGHGGRRRQQDHRYAQDQGDHKGQQAAHKGEYALDGVHSQLRDGFLV